MFTSPIVEMNRELADRIDDEVRANPAHPYKGKFVGIANGKVVAVADTVGDICEMLEKIEPENRNTYVLETGLDYSQPEYISETCYAPSHVASASGQATGRNRPYSSH
jgi:hypothetical protein